MRFKPVTVAVLMGGVSSERDVSLRSGAEVSKALQEGGYNVVDIIVNDRDVEELNNPEIDVAFIALHGDFGEDGGIQELLETRGIPYTGSGVEASRLAMDKIASKGVFNYYKLSTPPYIAVVSGDNAIDMIERTDSLSLPLIVKPAANGSSVGITVIRERGALEAGVNGAMKYGNRALIERYIEGRELTVGILNDKPLPIVEIKPASSFYDYFSKYQAGQTQYITSAALDPIIYKDVQRLALHAHRALGCRDLSRVDIILGNDGSPYLLEVNTIPGFTNRSLFPMAARAANIGFVQLCDMLVNMALNRSASKRNHRFHRFNPICV